MAFALGLYTSDPNLLRCELSRLRGEIALGDPGAEPMGAGWYGDEAVLLQRYSAEAGPAALDELGGVLESDALIVHGGPLPSGLSIDENTQPFRFRHWMFAHRGEVPEPEHFRARALDSLPEHLTRSVRGVTADEAAFAVFLGALRELGRTDDPDLEAGAAAAALGSAARRIEALCQEAGGRRPALAMIATNGRMLVAARLGDQPLYFRLLEGSTTCDVCQLDDSPDKQAAVRAHQRRRSVVVATKVRHPQAWMAVESGTALGVGRGFGLDRIAF